MIKLIFTLFLLPFYLNGVGQVKLTIIYKTSSPNNISGVSPIDSSRIKLIFGDTINTYSEYTINDSVDFFDYITVRNYSQFNLQQVKEERKNLVLGDVLGTFSYRYSSNYRTGVKYEQVTIFKEYKRLTDNKPYRRGINYVLIDSIKNKIKKWTLTDNKKKILDYECKQAFLMEGNKIIESVWYTAEFNCNFSMGDFLGLDGVILEEYFPNSDTFTTAIDIDKNAKPIVYPKYKKSDILTRDRKSVV